MPTICKIETRANNKIDQIKTALKLYAVMKKSKVSDLQITLMAYLVIYGINDKTKQFIITELKLCKTLNSYKKAMTVLKSERLLIRDTTTNRYEISPDIKLNPKEDINLLIRIEKPKI